MDGDIQGQRARQAELRRREDEQEIRDAAAEVEAALLAESLLRSEMRDSAAADNGIRSSNDRFSQVEEDTGEPLEFLLPGHYKLPVVTAQDPIPHLASIQQTLPASMVDPDPLEGNSIFTSSLLGNGRSYEDRIQNDEPELDDRSLLYTEGGLVFLNSNNKNRYNDWALGGDPVANSRSQLEDYGFYDAPLTKEDEESLMYLKRFIGSPAAPEPEREFLRRPERRQLPSDFDNSDFILYGNPESVDDAPGNGYEELSSILAENYGGGNMGFERQERLDVKKPGPWYRTVNNYAFDKEDLDPVRKALSKFKYMLFLNSAKKNQQKQTTPTLNSALKYIICMLV